MQDLDPSDICKKNFLNPLKGIRVIIRTPTHGRTDGRTDRQTDRRTDEQGESSIPPLNFVSGGITSVDNRWSNPNKTYHDGVFTCQEQYITALSAHIDGLVKDCSISSALAMGKLQSCTKPSVWYYFIKCGAKQKAGAIILTSHEHYHN